MKYKEYESHNSLKDYINCFWILEKEYDFNNRIELVFPDSYIEMIFHYGSPYKLLTTSGLQLLPPTFLIGLLSKPLSLYSDGLTKIICIRFYPWGARTFFPDHIKQSHNHASGVTFKGNSLVDELKELLDRGNYDLAVELLQNSLLEFVVKSVYKPEIVRNASEYLFRKKGQCRIDEVADYCHRSLRQVQRNFNDEMGIPMKSVAKNFRFDEIKKKLTKYPDSNFTDIAFEFGFYDLAHFLKEFKGFTGLSPSDFCAQIKEIKSQWGENVVFLQ